MFNYKIFMAALALSFIGMQASQANEISADFMNSNFESEMTMTRIDSIDYWQQPRTKYTPKNLRSEANLRVNGYDAVGKSHNSYPIHLTDYDTYIVETYQDGKYIYAKDNTGKVFVTGIDDSARIDNAIKKINKQGKKITKNTNAIEQTNIRVDNAERNIARNTQSISRLNDNVGAISSRLDTTNKRIDALNERVDSGLATVSALTALHPNPRDNSRTQIAVGTGVYRDNVAGAIGVFHWINDRIMLSGGIAYGGDSEWAGNVGLSIGLGKKNNK